MTSRSFLPVFLSSLVSLTAFAAPVAPLSIAEDGTVLLESKPFRGIGVNYMSAFSRRLAKPDDTSYRQGFAALKEHGIRFARFMACGFYPNEWKLYFEDKEQYFSLLDDVVRAARESGVGLIPSVFWWYPCVPDLCGEPCSAWGDPKSKTHALMKQYVTDMVKRYKGESAIWAWEMGNEYHLSADIPNLPFVVPDRGTPAKRGDQDVMSSAMVETALRAFAETVRALDPARPITSGDAAPRESAHHLRGKLGWIADSADEYKEELLLMHPDPVNLISTHIYPEHHKKYFGAEPASFSQHLELTSAAAKQAKKGVFVGEFGAPDDEKNGGPEVARKEFDEFLDAFEKCSAALAALWVYDFPWHDSFANVTASNARAWQLDAIGEANKRLKSKDGQ